MSEITVPATVRILKLEIAASCAESTKNLAHATLFDLRGRRLHGIAVAKRGDETMKSYIKSGTIKVNGKNIPVVRRECDAKGNVAETRDGRAFFSDRRTGYIEIPKP